MADDISAWIQKEASVLTLKQSTLSLKGSERSGSRNNSVDLRSSSVLRADTPPGTPPSPSPTPASVGIQRKSTVEKPKEKEKEKEPSKGFFSGLFSRGSINKKNQGAGTLLSGSRSKSNPKTSPAVRGPPPLLLEDDDKPPKLPLPSNEGERPHQPYQAPSQLNAQLPPQPLNEPTPSVELQQPPITPQQSHQLEPQQNQLTFLFISDGDTAGSDTITLDLIHRLQSLEFIQNAGDAVNLKMTHDSWKSEDDFQNPVLDTADRVIYVAKKVLRIKETLIGH
ncbi:UNVERIFIED_CONTAM: hypothetical protein HDU68_003717, partial [Siphonaria sp. JEL0065]